MATTVGPLEIEILDPHASPDHGDPADVLGFTYEPPPARPSRLEPVLRQAEDLERRLDTTIFRLGNRRALHVHGNPRRDSRVRQHIWLPFSAVRMFLADPPTELRAGSTRLVLTSGFSPTPKRGLRADGVLRLRGSWPRLPVSVTVEPWWRNRTVATVTLRRTNRWRYPRRYFAAAHTALRRLAAGADEWAVQESNL